MSPDSERRVRVRLLRSGQALLDIERRTTRPRRDGQTLPHDRRGCPANRLEKDMANKCCVAADLLHAAPCEARSCARRPASAPCQAGVHSPSIRWPSSRRSGWEKGPTSARTKKLHLRHENRFCTALRTQLVAARAGGNHDATMGSHASIKDNGPDLLGDELRGKDSPLSPSVPGRCCCGQGVLS